MIQNLLAFTIFIACGTGGEIIISIGMKKTGEPEGFRPLALSRFLLKAIRNWWFWLGIPMMAISFYTLLILLSWNPISLVIPISSMSYVVGALGAKYILKEDVSLYRWAGVLLVCIGVLIVATS
ncbi:MAG: DMT family transporter [Candidatus Acidiferrum sp.]